MVNSQQVKRFIPLLLSLLLALILVLVVQDFVQQVVVRPVLYTVWFVSLLIQSFPEVVLWAGFILFMFFAASSSLKKGREEGPSDWQSGVKNTGPVEKWARLLENAQTSGFSKWRLAQEFKRLHQKLQSPIEAGKEVISTRVDLKLPVKIEAFYELPQPSQNPIWGRLKRAEEESKTPLDLDPEIVIGFLEENLGGEFRGDIHT